MKTFMEEIAKEAGEIALKYFHEEKDAHYKDDTSIVTKADLEIGRHLARRISEKYPDHNIVNEEAKEVVKGSDSTWFIDPIDGTNNYSRSHPLFAVSIGFADKGTLTYGLVYLPYLDEIFYAQRGNGSYLNGRRIHVSKTDRLNDAIIHIGLSPASRRNISRKYFDVFSSSALSLRDFGSCAIEMCFVACGRADAMVRLWQHNWDYAAGMLIVQEAGGKVSGLSHDIDLMKKADILACNGNLYKSIMDTIR
jgi:myo-inositol-1(or 4)-monophosphatase